MPVEGDDPWDVGAPFGWLTRRMCDRASHWGRHRWTPNPRATSTTRPTITQVTTLREVGARSLRRALATARLLCLIC